MPVYQRRARNPTTVQRHHQVAHVVFQPSAERVEEFTDVEDIQYTSRELCQQGILTKFECEKAPKKAEANCVYVDTGGTILERATESSPWLLRTTHGY